MEFQVDKITKTDVTTEDIRDSSIRYKIRLESKVKGDKNPMTLNVTEDILNDRDIDCSFAVGDIWEIKKTLTQNKLIKPDE